ncbi:MAG: hypothetical protein VX248_04850 [Pseudomonadota bacterium]|nr:hypothetical protein [Pseudomonadota bacterium]
MKSLTTCIIAAFITISTAISTHAEPMPAADVKSFFASGNFSAVAGSKFEFSPNGTFVIRHSSGSEKGSYTIGADGVVTRIKNGAKKPDIFYIDINAKGKKTIVYTSGKYKGKKFPLR